MPRENLTRFAWLSIAAAVCTIALKSGAYLVTGSVGLLSDAAESVVNLVAAFVALIALHVAAKPADAEHQFGHSKAEYFSAAVEGVMIFVAATFIIYSSVQRFLAPEPLEQVGLGLGISVVASALNGAVAFVLMRAGRKHRSITLTADGKHLLTDVWTSAGVVVGVLLVALTGWLRLDPIIAFLVGCNIIWTGWHLVRESVDGLMDAAPSPECQAKIQAIIDEHTTDEVKFHGVRGRVSGHQNHVAMHVLVPGHWTVQQGHDVLEEVEDAFRREFDHITVDTHLEPIEDPRSYDDVPTFVEASPSSAPQPPDAATA
ncbi:MAG TPA: cation diffusion facilitator family transporter [Dermatophilaceae bacterium]|mgnify:FL=1|jgi:cation diffusion facilitator family transporter|nr:cation diffusion facilitator family transporter [Dermatophilaceae bacterium]